MFAAGTCELETEAVRGGACDAGENRLRFRVDVMRASQNPQALSECRRCMRIRWGEAGVEHGA